MCRCLLSLVAVLYLTPVVQGVVIDDFEEYMGTPDMHTVWNDNQPPVTQSFLMTSGAPQGYQAMDVDYHVAGGWTDPQNPTDYSSNDHAGLGRTFDPLDFEAGGSIKMSIQVEGSTNPGRANPDWDIMKLEYLVIEWSGDKWGQTLIPGPAATALYVWWPPPHPWPAIIAPDWWTPPGTVSVDTKIIHPSDGWVEIEITDAMWVPWGASLDSFDAMTGISLQLWSGWMDTSGPPKIDGTRTVWPKGPLDGSIDVDYILYVPEPGTIAMVGLGGLALVRRKR